MDSPRGLHRGSLALVALSSLGTAACADNNSSLFVRQVQAVTLEDECVVTNDPSAPVQLSGQMDLGLTRTYSAALLVGNQLVQTGDDSTLRLEASRVQLFEAEVQVFDFNANLLSEYTVPVSGFVDPANGTSPNFGFVETTLIDSTTADAVAASGVNQTVVSRVKVFGTTIGGLDVETGYFDFPIFMCKSGSVDEAMSSCVPCVELDPSETVLNPCRFGQDAIYDCRRAPADGNFLP